MTITFAEIPVDLRTGGVWVEIDPTRATRADSGIPSRALILGQRLLGSASAAGLPYRLTSALDAEGLFGRGSMLHRMVRAFRRANPWTELWAIPLDDDAGGTAAVGSFAFSGTPTQSGTLAALVCGRAVRVAITPSSTPTTVAADLRDGINAITDLPVTAALRSGIPTIVDVTARHKGAAGNLLDLRINYYAGESTPGGLTVGVTQPTGGAGNPELDAALAAMGDVWYSDVVSPYVDPANLAALAAELATRYGAMVARDGQAYLANSGSLGELAAFGQGLNSPHLSVLGLRRSPTPGDEIAATYGAISSYQYKQDPARGLRGLVLPGVLAPAPADRFAPEERNNLLYDGISTATITAGGEVAIERAISTYQVTAQGVDDVSYLDVPTLKSLASARYTVAGHIARRFPRCKLADDGARLPADSSVITPRIVKGEIVAAYAGLVERGICDDIEGFKADCVVERDSADRTRVNGVLPVRLIGRAEVFALKLQFLT